MILKQNMISYFRSNVIQINLFADFGKNLSYSLNTPNFVMIEEKTTKLEGGHNSPHPYFDFFNTEYG